MHLHEQINALSPEVAEIYEDIYITMVEYMNSMSLYDMMNEFDIFQYEADSVEQLYMEFTSAVLCELLHDSRFNKLPIVSAFVFEEDDSTTFAYVIASKRCLDCGRRNYLAITDDGEGFQLCIFREMPIPHRVISAPSCVHDVIHPYIGDDV